MTTTSLPDQPGQWGPRGTAAATFAARLSYEHVTHSYQDVEAVSDVSLELAPGEIMCLLGPSGCGKTTLLRIAAGLERPQAGRVLLDGEPVTDERRFVPPERRGVGLMFQDYALFPHLTILENVAFGLKGMARQAAATEAHNALRRVGLDAFAEAYPHELSGGEQQRVALARAIVPRPGVLLMDEPFSGLDQRLRDSVRDETLALLKETRSSALLVTHDPVEAMRMADRIALMRRGRLVQLGTPEALYRQPTDADAARFFSDFNELEARVQRGAVMTPLGRFSAPAGLESGAEVLVLIRPQGIRLTAAREGHAGYVTNVRFLGDASLVTLLLEGMEEPVTARMRGAKIPAAGETVSVTVEREHVFVFPQAEASTRSVPA